MHLNQANRQSQLAKTIAVFAAIVFICVPLPTIALTTANSAFEQIKLPANLPNPLNIRQYRLKSNGLNVLLCEQHSAPVITTIVVYKVGSRNEAVGYTGATHFLEHLMFKGTKTHDPLQKKGLDDLLKPVGGFNNATTSQDRTSYYEVVPSKNLNLCLQIEADRMRNLLLRKSDRGAEMTVVRNELERGEDDPQELLQTNMFSTAFREHPYHHPVIGWRSDVENVPIERLRQFYNDFYWPDNATLTLVGDFKTSSALASIEKFFGKIPRAPKHYPLVYTSEPPQEGERRFTVQRGSDMPKLMIGFHIVPALHKDTYPLAIIENLLGDESKRSSRLYKRLIDTGLASDVSTSSSEMHDAGLFTVYASASSKTDLSKIEQTILAELEKLKTEPVSPVELERAKKSITKHLKLSCSDPMGLADQITEAIAAANLQWWLNYSSNVQVVSPAEVMRVAKKYFTENNRTVGYYKPKQEPVAEIVKQDAELGTDTQADLPPTEIENNVAFKVRLAPTLVAPSTNFEGKVLERRLPNGLKIVVMPVPGTATVAISGKVRAGSYFRSANKTQVPEFVADLLSKGSFKYSKERLANLLEDMGTSLSFGSDEFWLSVDTEVTTEDFSKMVPIISDCLRKPTFSPRELKKAKEQKASTLKDHMADTTSQAWNAFVRALYKPTSAYYSKSFPDQLSELNQIDPDDLRQFHEAHIIPANTVLTVVGDINADDAANAISQEFKEWHGGSRQDIKVSRETELLPPHPEKLLVNLPDKANADIFVGRPLPIKMGSLEYRAFAIANAALGYDSFACRLAQVRDKFGLSYSISSSLSNPFEKFSPWAIAYSVNPGNFDKTLHLVRKIVSQYIKEGITPAEVKSEKTHLIGTFYVSLRSAKQIAARLCEYEILGSGPEYIDSYARCLDMVKINEVNDAIRHFFNLDNAVVSGSGTFGVSEKSPAKK